MIGKEYVEYWSNRNLKLQTVYLRNSRINGPYKEYYENGNLKLEQRYENNKLNGVYKERFKDSRLKIDTNYKDGKKDGSYKQYIYGKNKSIIKRFYKDGLEINPPK